MGGYLFVSGVVCGVYLFEYIIYKVMSGYKVGGKDLDSIFIPGSGYSTSTKFTVGSGKTDLQNRYMNYRLNKYTSATNYKIAGGTDLKDIFEWGGYTPSISNPGASSVSPTKETVRINGNFYKAKVTINGTDYWLGSGSGGSVTDWSNTAATVTVTGLSSNTAYNDKTITVYNYFGDSVTSSVSFTTIDIARITSIDKSGEPTTSRIDVNAVGNSSTVKIIVSCDKGVSSQTINASSGTVNFTSGLSPGTSYTFTATPYDADGNPGETKQTSISTAKPAAPTVSIAKSSSTNSNPTAQIIVSCTVSNGTATVNYTGGTAQTVTADNSARDYTFTGLTPNTKYTFTVTSTDSYSQTSTATTDITTDQAVAVVLPVVTSFTGKATSTQNITLTVVADANTSYVIIKCTSHPDDVLDANVSTGGSTTSFDRNYLVLTAGTEYKFTATPYTSGGTTQGKTTDTLSVTTNSATTTTPPAATAPVLSSATATFYASGTTLTYPDQTTTTVGTNTIAFTCTSSIVINNNVTASVYHEPDHVLVYGPYSDSLNTYTYNSQYFIFNSYISNNSSIGGVPTLGDNYSCVFTPYPTQADLAANTNVGTALTAGPVAFGTAAATPPATSQSRFTKTAYYLDTLVGATTILGTPFLDTLFGATTYMYLSFKHQDVGVTGMILTLTVTGGSFAVSEGSSLFFGGRKSEKRSDGLWYLRPDTSEGFQTFLRGIIFVFSVTPGTPYTVNLKLTPIINGVQDPVYDAGTITYTPVSGMGRVGDTSPLDDDNWLND